MKTLLKTKEIANMILSIQPCIYEFNRYQDSFMYKGTKFSFMITDIDYTLYAEYESGEIIEDWFDNELPQSIISKKIINFVNKYKEN